EAARARRIGTIGGEWMKVDDRWRKLGWRHPLWDYVRFFAGLKKNEKYHREWLGKLKEGIFEVRSADSPLKTKGRTTKPQPSPEPRQSTNLTVLPEDMQLFLQYIEERQTYYEAAASMLRTKDEALDYCEKLKLVVTMTTTKIEQWQNSPNAMVAAVTNIAQLVCQAKSIDFVPKPHRRGVWLSENDLHVSARNLDGAIPSLFEPKVLWEIKEYWGGGEGKSGGSKMSDAVYECNLVGRELREYEERTKRQRIIHAVFLDGKSQWGSRQSDLKRFIDLFHQGIIDHLFIGKEVESEWQAILSSLV
ncbi:MAG: hypothetical protein ABI353_10920, partial [Isosphaeraceae bacterium]